MYTKPMKLNHKLYEDIPFNQLAKEIPDAFGIEVELEGRKLKTPDPAINQDWVVHADGSLRVNKIESEAFEYVLWKPQDLAGTLGSIQRLFKHLTSPGVEVFESYRTSIHVHVNYAADTIMTIYNAMILSIIFDELFVSQNGSHRIGNNFCLRARDAQGQINDVVNSTENHGNFYNMNHQNRYSAINFVSLMKFGTIEYRSMECTTDFDRVKHWVLTLDRIRKIARTFENPKEIILNFSKMDTKEFLFFVLGPQALMYYRVPQFGNMLREGMRLAQDIAFCSDWIALKPSSKKKNPQLKGLGDPNPNPWDAPVPEAPQPWPAAPVGDDDDEEFLP
jgi:hypothetical protein